MNPFSFIVQNRDQVLQLTIEHLWLVGVSTLIAVAIGIPLGILIARRPVLNRPDGSTRRLRAETPIAGQLSRDHQNNWKLRATG